VEEKSKGILEVIWKPFVLGVKGISTVQQEQTEEGKLPRTRLGKIPPSSHKNFMGITSESTPRKGVFGNLRCKQNAPW